MDWVTLISQFRDFLEQYHEKELQSIESGFPKTIIIDFSNLISFNLEVAQMLLDNPEDSLKALGLAADNVNSVNLSTLSTKVDMIDINDIIPQFDKVDINHKIPSWIKGTKDKILYLKHVFPTINQQQVARVAQVDKSTVSRAISRPDGTGLLEQGYLVVDISVDIELTSKGKRYLKGLFDLSHPKPEAEKIKKHFEDFEFTNLPESCKLPISELKAKDISRLVKIEGCLRQKSDIRPQVVKARFECPACGNILTLMQTGTVYKEPSRCSCGRKGRFVTKSKDLNDVQRWIVQENPDRSSNLDLRRIAIFLEGSLVKFDKVPIGNNVSVCGILTEQQIENHGVKTTKFDLFVKAVSVFEMGIKAIEVSREDYEKVKEFCSKGQVLDRLCNLFAQHIKGNSDVKRALILQLVSRDDDFQGNKRGRIHLYVGGSYGSGKSQLGKFSASIAPKSRFCNTTSASKVGLTASVVKDDYFKGWALEIGAIPLAGAGLCVIDEIDKMHVDDSKSIGEAMEAGTISIDKSNIHQIVSALAKILTLGNPKNGSAVLSDDVLGLDLHIISRFDLILRSEHIGAKELAEGVYSSKPTSEKDKRYLMAHIQAALNHSLDVSLTDENKQLLTDLFHSVRARSGLITSGVHSARFLEALWRLSVASAKVRLADKIEKEDCELAISLMKKSLQDRGYLDILEGDLK